MTVIAMPREMGTLGKDVALGVAERLGIEVVHHELVESDIAGRMNIDQSAVHQFLEGKPSLWDRWKIDANRLSRYTAEEVLELARQGNVLIRGWGAVSLLRRVPHVLCIRVCAPMDFRVKVMKERLCLDSDDAARREIEENDDAHLRSALSRNVSDWTNATNFDLVLNTQRVPIAQCVEQVEALALSGAFAETPESGAILADLSIETNIKNNLMKKENGDLINQGVKVYVSGGDVMVTGAVSYRALAEKAYQIAADANGVKRVKKNLTVTSPF